MRSQRCDLHVVRLQDYKRHDFQIIGHAHHLTSHTLSWHPKFMRPDEAAGPFHRNVLEHRRVPLRTLAMTNE